LIRPRENNVNHPEFIHTLQEDFSPDWGFSCFCPQIFEARLLETFQLAINYHNGLLLGYRGFHATAWSMYEREAESGFTFHYMTERIDDGRILLQGCIPIAPDSSYRHLEEDKAIQASASLDQLIDKLIAREVGNPPTGPDRYFSRKAWKELVTIKNPANLTKEEILHRLRCFEVLNIRIGERIYPVTDVVEIERSGRLTFPTKEGTLLKPRRYLYLPYSLFRIYDRIRPGQW
jgi:UDP-4-amino-4-deoxy-L-arabinose formyltransferase/UDP-glucuronic acid dehydrogenase (UDP-4-keto-hexauronic acid decarboxylating)